jgi:hypothetical protein
MSPEARPRGKIIRKAGTRGSPKSLGAQMPRPKAVTDARANGRTVSCLPGELTALSTEVPVI